MTSINTQSSSDNESDENNDWHGLVLYSLTRDSHRHQARFCIDQCCTFPYIQTRPNAYLFDALTHPGPCLE